MRPCSRSCAKTDITASLCSSGARASAPSIARRSTASYAQLIYKNVLTRNPLPSRSSTAASTESNRNRGRSDRLDNEGRSFVGSITHEPCIKSAYWRLRRLSISHGFCCSPPPARAGALGQLAASAAAADPLPAPSPPPARNCHSSRSRTPACYHGRERRAVWTGRRAWTWGSSINVSATMVPQQSVDFHILDCACHG